MSDFPDIRFFDLTYPVFIFVGESVESDVPVLIANKDDELCLPIFTDVDLAERHGKNMGWTTCYRVLKINHCESLIYFLESRPRQEFSSVYIDPWNGVGRWRTSKSDLIGQLKSHL